MECQGEKTFAERDAELRSAAVCVDEELRVARSGIAPAPPEHVSSTHVARNGPDRRSHQSVARSNQQMVLRLEVTPQPLHSLAFTLTSSKCDSQHDAVPTPHWSVKGRAHWPRANVAAV